ncbi:hypothetical protein FDB15_05780 [Clostridium botulinum]|uniref:hypothetical protein n=1 Tax=unclassified Clostridium TaxID=2614128 RepID=UPI000508A3D9|nr:MULTISPECIES: hypothetical protein [unclassified Clostridium]KFX54002.1 hypothetical protein KU40_18840 [Clostridium botulinum]MBY6779806.1 hypothetical protein [Clostridium botulinum]MBY6853002.1 hypothetical protein [Clostridium botulinum]MBY7007383.1 hypothetical protein [Clostridium botulinum]NFH71734.1 hypothetical protein [Clostridium botulinum]
MRIEKIRVIQLKNEYIKTFEGQDKLQNIVENIINCDEKVEYSEEDFRISDIAMEAYYRDLYLDENSKNQKIFRDLFLGLKDFKYTYSRWESEMKIKNPTKEQIAKHIIDTWFYEISPDDTEEIENIDQSQAYVFHEDVDLKCISADRVKEIILDFDKENIINTANNLKKELNSCGIFVEKFDDDDRKLIDDIMKIFEKSVEENTDILYIINYL